MRSTPPVRATGAFRLAPIALACLATAAGAQTPAPGIATQLETVVVTGIRRGIEAAISVKKNNDLLVEAISAEDIGKLPDASIAESISRLPGVSAQRTNGRAQEISIRGLGGDFATTLMNGREQVSTGDNRSARFNQYPAELLSGVTIYKTPDATLVGQGLAGTVDLQTVRPLNFSKRTVSLNARAEKQNVGLPGEGKGSSRDNPFHDYYIWREGVDGREPTNWEAAFNGSTWTWNEATGEYYLHMFSPYQPDLNWENPRLRAEVYALMRFWLDRGIDGFRMDVINMISKPFNADGSLPEAARVREGFLQPAMGAVINGPRLQEYLLEMRREVLDHYDCLTVGEAPGATPEHGVALTHPETGALSMLFQFEHMDVDSQPGKPKWALQPLHLPDLKRSLGRWQHELRGRGWNSLYLCNHDQPRVVSRFGDDGPWQARSAKLLGSLLHGLQGTPYVYQGEELGMTNYPFADIGECRDIETLSMWRDAVERNGEDPAHVLRSIRAKGRDNARTPMQWDASPQAGFTHGTPWLPVNPNHGQLNADRQHAAPDSVFHFYRRLIAMRKQLDVLVQGDYLDLDPDHDQLYAYLRRHDGQTLLVVANVGGEELPFTPPAELQWARLVISNATSPQQLPARLVLGPWETCWYLLDDDSLA